MPRNVSQSPLPPDMEWVPCNLCGQNDFVVVYGSFSSNQETSVSSDYMASTDRFGPYGQIVRCQKCELVYTNPRPKISRVLESYRHVEDGEYAQEDSSRSINAHFCLHTVKRFVSQGRLLDVGCSTGYFLNAARIDFDTQGLELSHWAAHFAKEKLKLDVLQKTLEEAPFPPHSFDVITLIDVLEHLTDPFAVLQKAQTLLAPGGLLYLVTPDITSFSAKILRGQWWGLRPAHIYYFSPRTLRHMLEKAGFEVVLHKSYGRIFTYAYWLSRLKNYPVWFRAPVEALVQGLGLENKFLYLDTRDSLEICAKKRE